MKLKEAIEKLKSRGYLISMPRVAILKYVLEKRTHHTAESVYEGIRKEYPAISLATVYNTLKMLSKEGILVQLNISEGKVYYDSNVHEHSHFLCTECDKIEDVNFICKDAYSLKEVNGNKIDYFHIYFYGICKDCLLKDKK